MVVYEDPKDEDGQIIQRGTIKKVSEDGFEVVYDPDESYVEKDTELGWEEALEDIKNFFMFGEQDMDAADPVQSTPGGGDGGGTSGGDGNHPSPSGNGGNIQSNRGGGFGNVEAVQGGGSAGGGVDANTTTGGRSEGGGGNARTRPGGGDAGGGGNAQTTPGGGGAGGGGNANATPGGGCAREARDTAGGSGAGSGNEGRGGGDGGFRTPAGRDPNPAPHAHTTPRTRSPLTAVWCIDGEPPKTVKGNGTPAAYRKAVCGYLGWPDDDVKALVGR